MLKGVTSGGGGLVVGNAVTGGAAYAVLREDGSQNLAASSALTFGGAAAGTGLAIAAGTATTDVAALDISRTNNNAAVATGVKIAFTDTTSAATFKPFQVLGGASGTTNLLSVDKNGGLITGAGTASAVGVGIGAANNGFYNRTANSVNYVTAGTPQFDISALKFAYIGTGVFGFATGDPSVSVIDAGIARSGPNAIIYSGGGTSGSVATSRAEINKAVTAIADATPTATFTVTVPNAAHSAMLKVTLVGSIGAGGAIGANEATGTISYDIAIARTAGVNAVASISSAYGSATAAVAGATTITVAGTLSAISGAVGATNTFTVNVTITKGGGSSANHTCLVYGRLMNANATGVTIA